LPNASNTTNAEMERPMLIRAGTPATVVLSAHW
jgi:hypothetical protein